MLIVVSVNNKILLPLDLQCLLKPYNDYDIWYNSEEIEQWNFYILDSSIEINYWNSYKSIVKWLIIIHYLSSKCNLRLQTTISKASNRYSALSNSVRYFAFLPNSVRNRLYVWLINTPQIWSKQLSAPPQSVALECNDQSQKWQHCPIVLFITLKCAELLWNFHQLIATSSLAIWFLWFSFFPSSHSLSFFLLLLLC